MKECLFYEMFLISISQMPKMESNMSETCSTEELESQRLIVFTNLAVIITASIQRVVEFAKRVPGNEILLINFHK